MNSNLAYITSGTVQPYAVRSEPYFFQHFGRAEYHRDRPVLPEDLRKEAQSIIDHLNDGLIDDNEARRQLIKL
jgi:hypothetical protein